jgi:hypothetical protein
MQKVVDNLDVKFKPHDIVANDDHTVALVEATSRAGDETSLREWLKSWHVEDGKVLERWEFAEDSAAFLKPSIPAGTCSPPQPGEGRSRRYRTQGVGPNSAG